MRACLFYVCKHAPVYRRLQAEIDEFFGACPDPKMLTYNQVRQLPFLNAVISEATRLHPSIIYQLLRRTPVELSVNGYKIPRDTPVGISPRAQNRDRAIWGDDADNFRPDRWLESEEKTRYFETVTMTFGGNGPRMCIGRNIALVCCTIVLLKDPMCARLISFSFRLSCSSTCRKFCTTSTWNLLIRLDHGVYRHFGLLISMICMFVSRKGYTRPLR